MTKSDYSQADEILRRCVHCGFCLATCPTYQLLGDELDSPRGRIYLIKNALEGDSVSSKTTKHLDRCLTCLSCETTCPSGVEYGKLLAIGRDFMENNRPFLQKAWRFLVRKILTTPLLAYPVLRPFRHSKAKNYPKPLPLKRANAKKRMRVLLLSGCVQPVLAPNINAALKAVLFKLGIEVVETAKGECCGAIDAHLSAKKDALYKVRWNLDNWCAHLAKVNYIIVSASGCGAMIKDYTHLFEENDPYFEKAKRIKAHTLDIAEFIDRQDLSYLKSMLKIKPEAVSLHNPCTLTHAQKQPNLIAHLLGKLGFEVKIPEQAYLCCGSAGTYAIFQPKLAKKLRERKISALSKSNAQVIVTANIGCLMHLQKGTRIPIRHWIELLV